MKPAIAEHITKAATLLVLEVLPGSCPAWRQEQIFHEVTTSVGMTGDPRLIKDLKKALRRYGKHEYEVWTIEDVLVKHVRLRLCS